MFYLSLVDGVAGEDGVVVGDIALTTVAVGADGQVVASQVWVAVRVARAQEELAQEVLEEGLARVVLDLVQVARVVRVQEAQELEVQVQEVQEVQEQEQELELELEVQVAALLPQVHKV